MRNWTDEEFHNTRRFRSLTEALAPFKDDALLFEPGTSTQYTSYGFTLLGAAVVRAGGAPPGVQLRRGGWEDPGRWSPCDGDQSAVTHHPTRGYWGAPGGTLLNEPSP